MKKIKTQNKPQKSKKKNIFFKKQQRQRKHKMLK